MQVRGKGEVRVIHILWPTHLHESGDKTEPDLPAWFQQALAADRRGRDQVAIDIIYDNIDKLLSRGKFDEVDNLLRQTSTDGPSLTFLVGLLSITLPASPQLPVTVYRPAHFSRRAFSLQMLG
jgi:hypothetical protein